MTVNLLVHFAPKPVFQLLKANSIVELFVSASGFWLAEAR